VTRVAGAGVLLTGASRGIGEAAAVELANRGARLALAARDGDALQALAARLHERGAEVHVVPTDVSDEAAVRAMVATAEAKLGAIDVLVNNAGLGLSGPVEKIDPDDLRYVFAVNVMAPHIAITAVLPGMLSRKSGHIVNVGSVASHISVPRLGGYCSTKFALKALTDALRMEMRGKGVKVTLICPGPIRTDFALNTKGTRKGAMPTKPVGVPAAAAGRCIANAISRNQVEAFVPAYYQALVGADSLAPQVWRRFGAGGMRRATELLERFG
jgi:short-subunit dehydrogenase